MVSPIYVGNTRLHESAQGVCGKLVDLDGEPYYQVSNFDRLRPFFMSITSSSDHWMFMSSSGGLTAGRKNAARALFPYYTDDKIHESNESTGSKTVILVESGSKTHLWEPFSTRYQGIYATRRNLYKNILGNRVRFEETNLDLGLTFLYEWTNSEKFGFVKRSILRNHSERSSSIRILDGLQNILPYGVDRKMQESFSTLVDAYKKNELLPDTGLGLFVLSSIPVDRAEPSEALKATTVWSIGLEPCTYLLSALQLDRFRLGLPVDEELDVRAERGAYFQVADFELEANAEKTWFSVAEVNQGPSDVRRLAVGLGDKEGLLGQLKRDIEEGTRSLRCIVASSDGWQRSEDALVCARHVSNTLFNLMRGGVFLDGYDLDVSDVGEFVRSWNTQVAERNAQFLSELPTTLKINDLTALARAHGDPQLRRLCYEYLPLTFSRRHGDPSRPWNEFAIETRKEDGSRNLHFEGNWRDIFQNWEALSVGYPAYLVGMVAKFVNASTADGYNPYRISRDGIDWEVSDPNDPWSHIGYWGDHQLIYLVKLLELTRAHYPGALEDLLADRVFSYANVPYRIKPYEDLLTDPHNTIRFDRALQDEIEKRVSRTGSDGRLVWAQNDGVYLVSLSEKLLVTVLAKLANFIPEAGIWMNTQRPEWNDANNALVGNGVSVVTLCYLRRFLTFCRSLFAEVEGDIDLSAEVAVWLRGVTDHLARYASVLDGTISDENRRAILDALGGEACRYRSRAYSDGFGEDSAPVPAADIQSLLDQSLAYVDHSIAANRRDDGLFHAYNVIAVSAESIAVRPLHEMLEGQVAILSSGFLSAQEALELLEALKSSRMYREDQHSYMLYPDRTLPRFLEKNTIPQRKVAGSTLIRRLLEAGDASIVEMGANGELHFNGRFRNKYDLEKALDALMETGFAPDVENERALLSGLFEDVFDHRTYTGRSGTFFGYEGLGSIYWHMVSKLLLAVGETYHRALAEGQAQDVLDSLAEWYHDIKAGIGVEKNPADYGAIPLDPYSHTPGTAGAQQPGMTGQVKEDILARWLELGVLVSGGSIEFRPALMKTTEFLQSPQCLEYVDVTGAPSELGLDENALAFTYCQVPIVYRRSGRTGIKLRYADGRSEEIEGSRIDSERSAELFRRTGSIQSIEVMLAD